MAAHPDPVDRVSTPTPPVVPPVPAGLASRIADRAPRVLVVGDALLDGWLSGPVRRLGRDGPVPVVELVHSHSTCGGAANTAANLAALGATVDLLAVLGDDDPSVAEAAAWACGEREHVSDAVLTALVDLATSRHEPLVRESAVAALGALGDERGLDAILAGTADKPAIRRRAVLALAPFVGPDHPRAGEVANALQRALTDRDWQVRQAAEDVMP